MFLNMEENQLPLKMWRVGLQGHISVRWNIVWAQLMGDLHPQTRRVRVMVAQWPSCCGSGKGQGTQPGLGDCSHWARRAGKGKHEVRMGEKCREDPMPGSQGQSVSRRRLLRGLWKHWERSLDCIRMFVETVRNRSPCFLFMCMEKESSFGVRNQIQGLKDKKIEVGSVNHTLENVVNKRREIKQWPRKAAACFLLLIFFYCGKIHVTENLPWMYH